MRFVAGRNPALAVVAYTLAIGAVAVLVVAGVVTRLGGEGSTASAGGEGAQGAFRLAEEGCPMAHCEPQMSDAVHMYPPPSDATVVWRRTELPGEDAGSYGLGCSGNGVVAACTFQGTTDNLVVYDYDGNRLWTSGTLLNSWAWTSAPLVDALGGVIAADSGRIIRFDQSGNVLWNTETPGGVPISPVITENGAIVLATWGGPISAYDSESGDMLAELWVREYPGGPGFFETINTPGVRGNRVYVSTRHQVDGVPDEDNLAWLVAIDVDPANPDPRERLSVAWYFTFGGPSGASPLVIGDMVYFDGDRTAPGTAEDPHVFAVKDDVTVGTQLWRQGMTATIVASFARDPRGGFWVFPLWEKWLIRLDENNGSEIERIDVDALVEGAGAVNYFPSSAMTITEPDSAPAMVLSVFAGIPSSTYVIAIDLVSGSLLWKVELASSASLKSAGQFPILGSDEPRVVFPTLDDGVWAIGQGDPGDAVGGVAGFSLVGPEASLSEAGSSGSNTIILAGAAAVGALLLMAGAWYARRRWRVG